jgi:FkbM family methyltransferase
MKKIINRILRSLGFYMVSVDRLGVQLELDLCRLSKTEPIRVVFDVGANLGQSALRFADEYKKATIYSFEPVPETYKGLCRRVARLARVHAFNLAMGDCRQVQKMVVDGTSGANSLRTNGAQEEAVAVNVETLDNFCASHEIKGIDLLKIDVEGYEMQVLGGACGLLESGAIRFIYAECELVNADYSSKVHTPLPHMQSLLEPLGFCVVAYYAESLSLKEGRAMGNVLFALRSRLPDTASGLTRNIF